MRNLLALLGLAIVLFLGLGYYFQWYHLVWKPGSDGKQNISFEVDTKKIGSDTKEFGEKVVEKGSDAAGSLKKTSGDPKSPDFVGPTNNDHNLLSPPK